MSKAEGKLNIWLDEREKEYKEFWEKLGKEIGYTGKDCMNCGRNRVIKYSSGTKICEKCNFDQDKKEYNYEIMKFL